MPFFLLMPTMLPSHFFTPAHMIFSISCPALTRASCWALGSLSNAFLFTVTISVAMVIFSGSKYLRTSQNLASTAVGEEVMTESMTPVCREV